MKLSYKQMARILLNAVVLLMLFLRQQHPGPEKDRVLIKINLRGDFPKPYSRKRGLLTSPAPCVPQHRSAKLRSCGTGTVCQ